MDPTRIAILDLARRRLEWAERRQAVLARNVANIATPGFQARDMAPFQAALGRAQGGGDPAKTQAAHLGRTDAAVQGTRALRAAQKTADGNTVGLEDQLSRIADTESQQAIAAAIHKKYMAMFGMALGKG